MNNYLLPGTVTLEEIVQKQKMLDQKYNKDAELVVSDLKAIQADFEIKIKEFNQSPTHLLFVQLDQLRNDFSNLVDYYRDLSFPLNSQQQAKENLHSFQTQNFLIQSTFFKFYRDPQGNFRVFAPSRQLVSHEIFAIPEDAVVLSRDGVEARQAISIRQLATVAEMEKISADQKSLLENGSKLSPMFHQKWVGDVLREDINDSSAASWRRWAPSNCESLSAASGCSSAYPDDSVSASGTITDANTDSVDLKDCKQSEVVKPRRLPPLISPRVKVLDGSGYRELLSTLGFKPIAKFKIVTAEEKGENRKANAKLATQNSDVACGATKTTQNVANGEEQNEAFRFIVFRKQVVAQ